VTFPLFASGLGALGLLGWRKKAEGSSSRPIMPNWLRIVSHLNPLTYEVDALRSLMLTQGISEYSLLLDFGVLLATTAVLTGIAAKMYGRMGY
jgi:ABC-type multidrug transport system permease subunit